MRHRRHEHDDDEEEILTAILIVLENIYTLLIQQSQSTTAKLSIGEQSMATTATLTFTDNSGANQPAPTGDGSGLVVTFSSDVSTVTIGAATQGSGDTFTAPITGTDAFNLSAEVANSSGATLLDDDGVTPFVQPPSIAVPAGTPPAQATTAVLSVS
jgi:hypothetical protein